MRSIVLCIMLAGLSSAQNAFDMEVVREALLPVSDAAMAAYEELLADSASAEGTLTLSFSISRDGFVGDVAVEGDSVLAPVAEAMESAASEIRFGPMPTGSTAIEITVPFEFRPPEEQ